MSTIQPNQRITYAECQEYESYYRILNVLEFADESEYHNQFCIRPLSRLAIKKIDNLLPYLDSTKESLIILKPFYGEVNGFNIHKVLNSNLLPDDTDIDNLKNSYLIMISQFFDTRINTVSNLTHYEFTVLNNELMNNGFFITNDNKEEVYIDILEKEDDHLINILEKYLICQDEIQRSFAAYEMYRTFKQSLQEASTTEEISSLANTFIDSWKAKADYIQVLG